MEPEPVAGAGQDWTGSTTLVLCRLYHTGSYYI